MAKFKVDDLVRARFGGDKMRVEKVGTDGSSYLCLEKDGTSQWFKEGDLTTANSAPISTNPVVQNALAAQGVARNADGDPESLVSWKRIYPKLKEFNSLAGWLKGEGVKLMNVARNFDDKKFHSVGRDVEGVCEWAERKSAEILNRV